jgi:hypothetical protein
MVRQRAAVESCWWKPVYAGSNPAPGSNLSSFWVMWR